MELPSLDKLRRDDSKAWDQVFNAFWPVVKSRVEDTLNNNYPQEVEDVTCEVMFELVEQVKKVRSVHQLIPRTLVIAKRKSIDRIRALTSQKAGAGQVTSLDDLLENSVFLEPANTLTPDKIFVDKDIRQLLSGIMNQLKQQQKSILMEFFFGGKSYEEIAQKYEISINSVGVYLTRAMDAMRKHLDLTPSLRAELKGYLQLASWFLHFLLLVP